MVPAHKEKQDSEDFRPPPGHKARRGHVLEKQDI